MNDEEKLTCKLQTRVTQSQKDKVDELGVNLREIVDYYITHKTNPTLELKNRQKELLKKIGEWEKLIEDAKEELKEVNYKLGVPIDESIATIDVITIAERIKDNCEIEHDGKSDELTLRNYMDSNRAKTIIKHGIAEFNIRGEENRERFKSNVFKYLKLD